MTPERLTVNGTSEERELLRSALEDSAAPGAKAQLLVALLASGATVTAAAAAEGATLVGGAGASGAGAGGAAATGVVATGTTVGTAGSAALGTATAASGGGAAFGALGVAKWVGIGLLAGTTTTAVVATTATPVAVEVEQAAPAAPDRPVPPRLGPQPEDPVTRVTPVLPTPEAVEATPSARPRVGEEIENLDRARAALQAGNATEAERVLGEYRRAFPRGAMGPEAAVLEVRVALARGDRERAAALARSFLVRHDGSPHAPRMRALLTSATAPADDGGAAEPRVVAPGPVSRPAAPANDEIFTATPSRTPSVARFED